MSDVIYGDGYTCNLVGYTPSGKPKYACLCHATGITYNFYLSADWSEEQCAIFIADSIQWDCPPSTTPTPIPTPTPETKSNFVGTITIPSLLSPQTTGATPIILNSLTIQNTGNKSGYCSINVYEATSAGADIKMLNNTVVTLNPDETYNGINIAAVNGLSKTYAAGDTLYLCFKTWGIDESEPSCGGSVVSIPVQSETETKEYFIKP